MAETCLTCDCIYISPNNKRNGHCPTRRIGRRDVFLHKKPQENCWRKKKSTAPPDFSRAKVGMELKSLRYGKVIVTQICERQHILGRTKIGIVGWYFDGILLTGGNKIQDLYWKPIIIETGGPPEEKRMEQGFPSKKEDSVFNLGEKMEGVYEFVPGKEEVDLEAFVTKTLIDNGLIREVKPETTRGCCTCSHDRLEPIIGPGPHPCTGCIPINGFENWKQKPKVKDGDFGKPPETKTVKVEAWICFRINGEGSISTNTARSEEGRKSLEKMGGHFFTKYISEEVEVEA